MSLPVALSGFMGAGKTTVGARVARELGVPFVDLDREVEAAFAMPVAQVFEQRGEPAFRAMEARLLRQALRPGARVVALGGGAVVDAGSRDALRSGATWVHLDVPFRDLAARLSARGELEGRPLWSDREAARALFESRRGVYAEAPHRVDGSDAPGVVAAVVRSLVDTTATPHPRQAARSLEVRVPGAEYTVHVGAGLDAEIAALGREVGTGPIALITDWNVGPLHADRVARLLAAGGRRLERVVLPAGEPRKRIGPVVDVVERLLDRGWQRSAPVVALGGGVLGDMAGLVASLTLRGVPFVQLPTTLLAMVDSSVGGKVGVDHRQGKNLIGAFHQPAAVVADLRFLRTLPAREIRAGLGEVVKSALLGDVGLLELLEARADAVLAADPGVIQDVVTRCVAFKAGVVAADEKEAGRRRILNLGHTIGHALEAATDFALLHGEAVAVGLVAAAQLSVERAGADASLPTRVATLLESLGLPTRSPSVSGERMLRALAGDKKRVGDDLRWILLEAPGRPRDVRIATRELSDMLRSLNDHGILTLLE